MLSGNAANAAICIFFATFGWISRCTYARPGDRSVAGLSNAVALAWAMRVPDNCTRRIDVDGCEQERVHPPNQMCKVHALRDG
jgi:hypothetical protein